MKNIQYEWVSQLLKEKLVLTHFWDTSSFHDTIILSSLTSTHSYWRVSKWQSSGHRFSAAPPAFSHFPDFQHDPGDTGFHVNALLKRALDSIDTFVVTWYSSFLLWGIILLISGRFRRRIESRQLCFFFSEVACCCLFRYGPPCALSSWWLLL